MLETGVRAPDHIGTAPIDVLILSTNSLPKFEVLGGLVSGTEESRGRISIDRPNRYVKASLNILSPLLIGA